MLCWPFPGARFLHEDETKEEEEEEETKARTLLLSCIPPGPDSALDCATMLWVCDTNQPNIGHTTAPSECM